jgi:hypothetical protein
MQILSLHSLNSMCLLMVSNGDIMKSDDKYYLNSVAISVLEN